MTVLDPNLDPGHAESIKENRRDYASRHGYETFFPSSDDYDLTSGVPASWSTLPALRHAMKLFPTMSCYQDAIHRSLDEYKCN